jgi:hypothetical protein
MPTITTALKAAAAIGVAACIAAAIWYVLHLRGQVADLTQANANLQASVAVANTAAADSAKAAQQIAAADFTTQTVVAAEHATIMASDAATDTIMEGFNHASTSDLACAPDGGLPAAYLRGLDQLFEQPAPSGGGAGGSAGQPEAAAGMH